MARNSIIKVMIIAFVLCATALVYAAGQGAAFPQKDVQLFCDKCGRCHGWNKAIAEFEGMPQDKRSMIVAEMSKKKTGWISDQQRDVIDKLLSTNDFAGLTAAVNSLPPVAGKNPPAADVKTIIRKGVSMFHGIFMAALFFVLGIGMAMSGLKRHYDKLKTHPGFPGKFEWKKHVLRGKIYIVGVILGLCGGLSIWALSSFSIWAMPHFINGLIIATLYACGGLAGLKMAKGKGTPALRKAHLICNLTATVLFALNVLSGIYLVTKLLG